MSTVLIFCIHSSNKFKLPQHPKNSATDTLHPSKFLVTLNYIGLKHIGADDGTSFTFPGYSNSASAVYVGCFFVVARKSSLIWRSVSFLEFQHFRSTVSESCAAAEAPFRFPEIRTILHRSDYHKTFAPGGFRKSFPLTNVVEREIVSRQ